MPRLLLIAVSLALDAMAVSVSVGLATPGGGLRLGLRLAAWFGSFQFLMPLLGCLLGRALAGLMAQAAPFAAFGILTFLGLRMAWDALLPKGQKELGYAAPDSRRLFLLAVATSIDALAAGVSITLLGFPLWLSAAVIGAVAFGFSLFGATAGRLLGRFLQPWAQLAGGAALVALALKFLLERLV